MRAHYRTAVSISAFLVAALLGSNARPSDASGRCAGLSEPSGGTRTVARALTARRDVLGERLIASRTGPTYDAASRLLPPLWYARGRGGVAVTRSGAYYLTFAYPLSLYGEKAFALHVADGSAVLTRRSDGPSLTLYVGDGEERYGSCLSRLTPPTLARGYLPVVRTAYIDGRGVRYEQESFAGRVPGVKSLVSFLRLKVDSRATRNDAGIVRLLPSVGSRQRLVTDRSGRFVDNGVAYRVQGRAVIHAAWVHRPTRGVVINARVYDAARRDVERFWKSELARGVTFDVPERRVMDAQRHLLGQQRILTWRYSIGNNYEELSFAEALDAAQVMAAYGHGDVSEAILRFALRRLPVRYTNWRAGAVLAAAAYHDRVTRGSVVEDSNPALVTVLEGLERQIHRPGGTGLLDREAFSSDVGRHVVALHGQAVVWTALVSMGRAWAKLGQPRLAARATAAARRLERALRSAVRASQRRLPNGSLFVPAALLDGASPFDRVTASREGSYWNLVMPYVLAAGLFDPKGREAQGIWEYMQRHGSRLLGLVRADADRLYRGAPHPASGVDQVYGLNMARFLADADLPDQLVLSLYGTLAGTMTRKTFVAGEAVTVAPLAGLRLGAMYLPPNGGTNTAFLETLRVMLVHERRNRQGAPTGLELAFATPRAWLGNAQAIRVRDAPTSFGPVSFAIERRGRTVGISVDAPPTPDLRLRLRLPRGLEIGSIESGGVAMPFDRASGTIDLSGRVGSVQLVARIRG